MTILPSGGPATDTHSGLARDHSNPYAADGDDFSSSDTTDPFVEELEAETADEYGYGEPFDEETGYDDEDDPDDDPDDGLAALEEAASHPQAPRNADDQPDTPDEPPAGSRPSSREAAKYRTRLRAVEAERDQLAQRVTAYEHAQVDRIATEARMANPADFRLLHGDLDGLRGEDGALDETKVRAAVEQVLTERPYWRSRGMAANPAQGASARSVPTPAKSWADVLRQG